MPGQMKHSRGSRLAAAALLGCALFCASPAEAACTITTTSVAFGSYDVFSATPVDSTGTVSFQCFINFNVTVALSRGASTTFTPRTMKKGSEALSYNLYQDAARTAIWGDGTGGTTVYSNTFPPILQTVTLTIYGRIPPGQDISAGTYTDTIIATVNF